MPGRRSQRGVVFPSPVVLLSVVAVVLAAVAFFVTRDDAPTEREVATQVRQTEAPSSSPSDAASSGKQDQQPVKKQRQKKKPKPVERGAVNVEVYNNSGITGLAGGVADQASSVGWSVVGSDNWYGTIPENTVYYPDRLQDAAKQLALDLGIKRTEPAVGAMKGDRLTVILTGEL